MAQWDVHRNPAVQARDEIPFVVVVQSDLLASLPTRLVIPLSRSEIAGKSTRLAPLLDVAGEKLRLKPHEAGTLPARVLGLRIASLKDEALQIIDAFDTVISGV